MATTYSPTLSDAISKVRFEIGDIGDGAGAFTAPLFEAEMPDETITALLSAHGDSVIRASIAAAYSLAAKYAKMVDVDVDDQLTRASQRYKQYVDLAKRLESKAAGSAEPPNSGTGYVGGPLVFGIGDTRGPLDLPAWPADMNGISPT